MKNHALFCPLLGQNAPKSVPNAPKNVSLTTQTDSHFPPQRIPWQLLFHRKKDTPISNPRDAEVPPNPIRPGRF
jgi:hypothetical protein